MKLFPLGPVLKVQERLPEVGGDSLAGAPELYEDLQPVSLYGQQLITLRYRK